MAYPDEFVGHLEALAQLDIDAVHAYTSAIDRIDLVDVKRQLTQFRGDHERHITHLSTLIRSYGGKVPEPTPDVKGFFIQGFTAIRSMMGNEQAIKAMKGNEELTNKKYAEALKLDLPSDVRAVVQANRDDERKHLNYVNRCISSEIWKQSAKRAA